MNEIKYPIIYTIKPIYAVDGWIYYEKDENKILYYIVSKAALINSSTTYTHNGQQYNIYEVIFPYSYQEYTNQKSDIILNNTTQYVSEIFENFESAKKRVNFLNNELRRQILLRELNKAKNIQLGIDAINNYDTQWKKYIEYEQKIEELTKDLAVTAFVDLDQSSSLTLKKKITKKMA